MEARTLKSLSEYVDLVDSQGGNGGHYDRIIKYNWFVKQILKLGDFIPCDKDNKPLEKPEEYDHFLEFGGLGLYNEKECEEYQQACDRKIFTGFELYQDTYFNSYNCVIRSSDMVIVNIENRTIEDIAPLKVDLVKKVAEQFKY